MKKAIIKLASLLTAFAMMLPMAGCGEKVVEESIWVDAPGSTQTISHSSGSSGTDNSTSGNTSVNVSDRTTNVTDVLDDGNTYDLKGATVTIAGWGDYGAEVAPSASYYTDWVKMVSEIEKKYNCKIEYIAGDDSLAYNQSWVTAAQSGVKFADIVTLASSWPFPTQIKTGYLHPLDNYLNLKDPVFNTSAVDSLAVDGKHYLTVMINRVYVGTGLVFNKDILKKFGAKTPHDYIKANNWNFDTFLELAQKCTGKVDGVQYSGLSSASISIFAEANGGHLVSKQNGKYTFTGHTDEKYLKGAQFALDLTYKYKVTGGDFEKGTAAMSFVAQYNTSKLDSALGSNWGWAYIPKGWDVSDYQIEVTETTSYGIPSTVKNPEVIAKIMYDFFYPYKWRESFEQQAENQFPDATSLQIYLDMGYRGLDGTNLSPLYTYISREVGWTGLAQCLKDNTAPKVYLSSIASKAQAELDAVWEQ